MYEIVLCIDRIAQESCDLEVLFTLVMDEWMRREWMTSCDNNETSIYLNNLRDIIGLLMNVLN